jgi:hypothetical protein
MKQVHIVFWFEAKRGVLLCVLMVVAGQDLAS